MTKRELINELESLDCDDDISIMLNIDNWRATIKHVGMEIIQTSKDYKDTIIVITD